MTRTKTHHKRERRRYLRWSMAAFAMIVAFSANVQAQTGLYHTSAEIEEWNKRRANGPYRSNWQFVEEQARDWYNSNPSVWAGATSNSCFSGPNISQFMHRGIQSTAVIALLDDNSAYRSAVRDFLVEQAAQPGTDFSNGNRWCTERGALSNHGNLLFTTLYLRRLLTAYSFIRADLSAADRQTLDAWFYDAGVFVAHFAHNNAVGKRFPNRRNGDYSLCAAECPGREFGTMYYGSEMTHSFHNGWGNITMMKGSFMAEVAVLTGDAWLEEEAKRLFKEWLKYAVFPGGAVFDLHRWNNTGEPQRGWRYAGFAIGSAIAIADVFARTGDFELYEYETSDGKYGSEGGSKSLRQVATFYANITLHNTKAYASTTPTSDPVKLIDAFNENVNKGWVQFVELARPGVYYGDRVLKEAYDMNWPSPIDHAMNRQGSGYSYPSILGMFGGFEDNPPYPRKGGGSGGGGRTALEVDLATSSQDGSYGKNEDVRFLAEVSGAEEGIASVEFFADRAKIGQVTDAPYELTWTDKRAGKYRVVAKVTDANDAVATSASVDIVVGNPVNLANATTHLNDSNNFDANNPVEGLWDGDVSGDAAASPGEDTVDAFWVEFDLGAPYTLTQARLHGDAEGSWVSKEFTVQVKLNASDSYTTVIDGMNAFDNTWFGSVFQGTRARYVRLEVVGDTELHRVQAREFALYGEPSDALSEMQQEIPLQEGWNQISSSVEIEDPRMEQVLAELPEVTFVKDEAGRVYSPRYEINSIGAWKPTEGYKVYATTPVTLNLEGKPLSPQDTPIQLQAGWSIVPYILEESLPVEEAFATIAEVLVLAKDGNGQVYYPSGDVNALTELQPGQGYLIYLSEDATLVYPDTGQRAAAQKQGTGNKAL